jgi:hypothetical protein
MISPRHAFQSGPIADCFTAKRWGENKTRVLVFRRVHGSESDSLWLPAGKHQLRVRVQSPADRYDHSKTVAADFAASGENTLQIAATRNTTSCKLRCDGHPQSDHLSSPKQSLGHKGWAPYKTSCLKLGHILKNVPVGSKDAASRR